MNIQPILEGNNYCETEKLEVKVDLTKEVKRSLLEVLFHF